MVTGCARGDRACQAMDCLVRVNCVDCAWYPILKVCGLTTDMLRVSGFLAKVTDNAGMWKWIEA